MTFTTILFLNDNPLKKPFTDAAIAGKELRLRAAIDSVDHIHVLAFPGPSVDLPAATGRGVVLKKITVHHLVPWPYYFRAIPLFIAGIFAILKYRPRLIEAESPIISGVAAFFLGKLFKLPYLVEYRASYFELLKFRFSWIPSSLKRRLLTVCISLTTGHALGVIANSRWYQQQLRRRGVSARVINPGVRFTGVAHPPQKSPPVVIGYLGRLVPEKGVHLFIRSLELLDPSLRRRIGVEITGDGPERSRLEHLTRRLNLTGTVKFLGVQPNSRLSRWHLLVNPNLVNHPLEMVNAEAAWLGVPVICFGNRRLPETVVDGQTGIKVSPPTPRALSQAITQLVLQPTLRKTLSRQAPSFARRHYAFPGQVRLLRQYYRDLGII